MSEHTSEHEALVQSVVVGDTPADAPEVVRRRRECPACAHMLERAARASALLDLEAAEELAVLALAERQDDAPGAERIEAFRSHPEFRRWMRPPRRMLRWMLTAGAAALLCGWFLLRGTVVEPRPDVTLGTSLVVVAPFDGFGDDLVLRWKPDPSIAPDVADYELTIEGREFSERYTVKGRTWSDPDVARALPDAITVTVTARGFGRDLGTSAPLSGRRAR